MHDLNAPCAGRDAIDSKSAQRVGERHGRHSVDGERRAAQTIVVETVDHDAFDYGELIGSTGRILREK